MHYSMALNFLQRKPFYALALKSKNAPMLKINDWCNRMSPNEKSII